MDKAAVHLAVLVCSLFGVEPLARAQQDVFGNMVYLIEEGSGLKPVRLVNGRYTSPMLCVYYEGHVVRGDFNRDGLEDAAVVLYDSGCGSGYFLSLAFLIHDGGTLVHEYSHPLGYKADVTALTAYHNTVIVEMLVPDPRDGRGGVPVHVRKVCEYTTSH